MYESPVKIMQSAMTTDMENEIVGAVVKLGIQVDKEELLKALAYDRDQYDKGYRDGYRDAMSRLDDPSEEYDL